MYPTVESSGNVSQIDQNYDQYQLGLCLNQQKKFDRLVIPNGVHLQGRASFYCYFFLLEKNKRDGSPSWGDIVEMSESRPPGRAVQMHKKLSSPSRKRFVFFQYYFCLCNVLCLIPSEFLSY